MAGISQKEIKKSTTNALFPGYFSYPAASPFWAQMEHWSQAVKNCKIQL